jgi:hypothetical protein
MKSTGGFEGNARTTSRRSRELDEHGIKVSLDLHAGGRSSPQTDPLIPMTAARARNRNEVRDRRRFARFSQKRPCAGKLIGFAPERFVVRFARDQIPSAPPSSLSSFGHASQNRSKAARVRAAWLEIWSLTFTRNLSSAYEAKRQQ